MARDLVDPTDPRKILEELEETMDAVNRDAVFARPADQMRHVFAWILEGKTLVAVANRCYVAAYVSSPETVEGMTLHQIAGLSGKGRSATHNLAREFEDIFGVKSIHARSDEARKRYSAAFHERNGTRPHSYSPIKL